ncbi:MAG: response regulator [Xenococcaceae cyanobacterium]
MFNPNSQDKLTQYFLEEVTELLDTIEQNLYGLLEKKTTEKVHGMMRSAHTIKGSAANMELKTIETIAHHLEDVFQSLYAEDLEIDPELGSLLLDGYECLRNPLTATLSGTDYDETEALDRTATVFAKLQEKLGDFFGREASIPSSEELGFDVVGSIFADSISQDLQDLEQVIGSQDIHQITDKVISVAQFLQNIGLSYSLPGLTAIAETTLVALEKNPDDILSVAIAALENFYQAQNAIISGDRTSGGEILPQLRELAGIEESKAEVTVTLDESIPDLTEYSRVVEQAISESAEILESIGETTPVNSSSENTVTESNSDSPESENPEEESDSQIFAALFAKNKPNKAKVTEVLAPATTKKPISPIDRILQSIWIAKPEQTIEFAPTLTESSTTKNSESQGSIRVAVEQLDNLSQAMGELLIDDNLQTLQTEQFHNSTRQTLQQYRLCQQQLNEIYDWWDKQFLRSRHRRRRMSRNSSFTGILSSSERNSQSQNFDPLEMDIYSDLHVLLQNFNEKITELGEQIETIEKFASESRFNTVKRKQALSQAQDNLLNARMVSLGMVLERFPRMLKQMVASQKKPAELQIKGSEIQIDKAISDKLYEPLLHLFRNAYDHGLEDTNTRREQNKSATGTITIRAYNQGNRTFIEIEDDGRGLNWQRIRAKAVEKGILSPLDAETASQARLAEILFQSGFSTADSVSELSGRGVGLDAVRNQIENLGGRISLDSQTGKGTKFTLQLPLKLTTSRLLICQAQGMVYGILADTIVRIIVPQADQITTQASAIGQGEQTFLRWEEEEQKTLIPIADISTSITYQYPLLERSTNSILKTFPIKKAYRVPPLLLLRNQGEYICLRVEEIIVEQELVIKSLGAIIDLPDYIQGYTVLGDGSFTLVIEPHLLLSQGWKDLTSYSSNVRAIKPTLPSSTEQSQPILAQENTIATEAKHKLLVIEDSVFQRQSLVNTLEKSNYEVVEASNGQEAIEKLQQNKDIALIISDVEMPTMNGFEFLSHKQKDSNISPIPVIMVTTRSSPKHRQLAFSLGANEYHTKPYSDSELLNSITQLIGNSKQLAVTL